jgi:nitronate monooxygenase
MRSLGTMERVYKNEVAEKVVEMENRGATLDELIELILGKDVREAFETGNVDKGVLPCGQITGLIKDVPSVKELIDGMISGARDIMERLNGIAKA